ncbi:MAG: hypothetical protein WCG96_08900 [Actinomycetes bacterium]
MLHRLARATAPVALLLAISAAAPPIGAAAASPPLRAVAVASAVSYSAGLQGTDHSDSLMAIDCPAVGECTAVGSVKDAAGNSQATTIDQVDGTWGTAQAIDLGGHAPGYYGELSAISCTAVRTCTAAGVISDSDGNALAAVVSEVDGVWGPVVTLTFADGSQNTPPSSWLSSISCTAADACSVAGSFWNAEGNYESIVADEVAGTWGPATPLRFPDGVRYPQPNDGLNQIACSTPGNCTAVGAFRDAGYGQEAMAVSETDGVWGMVVPAAFPDGVQSDHGDSFASVSCTSAGNCTAAGFYMYPTYQQAAMVATQTDGVWAPVVTIALPASLQSDSNYAGLESISCTSPGSCSAVGMAMDANHDNVGLIVTETAGSWGEAQPVTFAPGIHAASSSSDELTSVSCSGEGDCTAGGRYADAGGFAGAMLVTETNGTWGDAQPVVYAKGMRTSAFRAIWAVSCASPGVCGAAGAFGDRHYQAMAVTFFSWAPAPSLSPLIGTGHEDLGPVIHWYAPATLVGPVRSYVVTAKDDDTAAVDTCHATGSGRKCRLLHLAQGHGYTISVAAKEVVGKGRHAVVVLTADSDSYGLSW